MKWLDKLMPKIIAKISMASKMAAKFNNRIDNAEKDVTFSYFDYVSLTDIVFSYLDVKLIELKNINLRWPPRWLSL